VICVQSAAPPSVFAVHAQSESVALLNATAPPKTHGTATHFPLTQTSSVFDESSMAVSPAVIELQGGRVVGLFVRICTS
jgi:hypothetical protein